MSPRAEKRLVDCCGQHLPDQSVANQAEDGAVPIRSSGAVPSLGVSLACADCATIPHRFHRLSTLRQHRGHLVRSVQEVAACPRRHWLALVAQAEELDFVSGWRVGNTVQTNRAPPLVPDQDPLPRKLVLVTIEPEEQTTGRASSGSLNPPPRSCSSRDLLAKARCQQTRERLTFVDRLRFDRVDSLVTTPRQRFRCRRAFSALAREFAVAVVHSPLLMIAEALAFGLLPGLLWGETEPGARS